MLVPGSWNSEEDVLISSLDQSVHLIYKHALNVTLQPDSTSSLLSLIQSSGHPKATITASSLLTQNVATRFCSHLL